MLRVQGQKLLALTLAPAILFSCKGGDGKGGDASRAGLEEVAVEVQSDLPLQCSTACDDGNSCTEDSCDASTGTCVYAALAAGTECDDGSACTGDDLCSDDALCTGGQISCEDYLLCTEDGCDPATGCTHGTVDKECEEPVPQTVVLKQPYLQSMQTNSVVVMWETVQECVGKVVYGPDENYGYSAAEEVPGTIHELALSGFEPGHQYRYRVFPCETDVPLPGRYHFTTSPKEPVPFRFAVWGDSRTQPDVAAAVCEGMAKSEPALVINVGDVVTDGWVYEQWSAEYFDPISPFSPYLPTYIAIGNHENDSDWFYSFVSQPAPEHYFAFTHGGARLVIIDSNKDFSEGSAQHDWLLDEFSSADYQEAEWHFVFFHHPPYSEQWDSEGYTGEFLVHIFLVPLLGTAEVDVLFVGHTHDYERGYIPDGYGMHYVITGGGGAPLDFVHNTDWEQITFYASEYHFMTVDVDQGLTKVKAWLLDGSLLDEFEVEP